MPTEGGHNIQTGTIPVTPCVTGGEERPAEDPGILDVNRSFSTKVAITVGDEDGDSIPITIQLQDAQGNPVSARVVIEVWLSASAFGVPAAVALLTVTAGSPLQDIVSGGHLRGVTNATGELSLLATLSTAETRQVMASSGDAVANEPATWS